jgi:hypothetical protein
VSDVNPDRVPPSDVDLDRPSVARIYDYYLGGSANWAVDRVFAQQVQDKIPQIRSMAIANRQFLNRAVSLLCQLGVRQFLDIGAGVPTVGNTHQVADRVAPESRVVYVDNEAVAVAHAEQLLDAEGDPGRHAAIDADLRNPDDLWAKAMGTGLLDPEQPIALLLIAVLHVAQPGSDGTDVASSAVARYRELLPSGSYLAISHVTMDGAPDGLQASLRQLGEMYSDSGNSGANRTRAEIEEFMGDFEIIEPGMTWTPNWHPEQQTDIFGQELPFADPSEAVVWAGVGRKPEQR